MRGLVVSLLLLCVGSATAGDPLPPRTERAVLAERLFAGLDEADRATVEGRHDAAERQYSEVAAGARALGEPNLLVARAIDGLGDVQRLSGRLAAAEQSYLESIRLWETLLGPEQPRLATTLQNLGAVLLRAGDPARAEIPLRRALAIWEKVLGPESLPAIQVRTLLDRPTVVP